MRKRWAGWSTSWNQYCWEKYHILRYADDTSLMAESEEEVKSFLMKVKEESEKVGLKLNIQKTRIMASGPITSWQIYGETVTDFIFWGSKIAAVGDWTELKVFTLLFVQLSITLFFLSYIGFSSVQFSCSVMSNSLWPHGLQHTRPPCPSPTPRVHSNSSPLSPVMPSSHLILCRPLLLLPPIPPSIRVFFNESTLSMRWPKYWSFSFSISPSNEHPGLISISQGWTGWISLQSKGFSRVFSNTTVQKHQLNIF